MQEWTLPTLLQAPRSARPTTSSNLSNGSATFSQSSLRDGSGLLLQDQSFQDPLLFGFGDDDINENNISNNNNISNSINTATFDNSPHLFGDSLNWDPNVSAFGEVDLDNLLVESFCGDVSLPPSLGNTPPLPMTDDFLLQETPVLDSTFSQPHLQPPTSSMTLTPPTTSTSPSTVNTALLTNSPLPTLFPPGQSCFPVKLNSPGSSSSASEGSSGSGKRKHPADEEDVEADKALKRQRNTMAARKYRQKRLDRISELEKALDERTDERDDLRLQLARREAEVAALREMLAAKK